MEYKTGWCVTLYSDESQDANDNREKAHFLSWSPYDRVQITSSNEFKNFIFPDVSSIVNWCGVKQQLHLVPLESFSCNSDDKRIVTYSACDWQIGETQSGVSLVKNINTKEYGLYCLVTARFSDLIIRSISNIEDSNYSQEIRIGIIHDVLQHINSFVIKNHMDIDCVSFESLGSEDFALILLANDVKTFSQILSVVRSQIIKLNSGDIEELDVCKSICTLVGFNEKSFNANPQLDALVTINVKSISSIEKIKKQFEQVVGNELNSCVLFQNKGVIEIKFKPSNLQLWHNQGLLNGTSDFYKKHIISSRTYWVEDIFEDDNLINKLLPNEFKESNVNILSVYKVKDIMHEINNKRNSKNLKLPTRKRALKPLK